MLKTEVLPSMKVLCLVLFRLKYWILVRFCNLVTLFLRPIANLMNIACIKVIKVEIGTIRHKLSLGNSTRVSCDK